ncbi:excalibur calcium-binding domain-containing protein [Streptomyces misionensis]|uniref:excalibur calcium-binding domain-containing protein n=1 Tax=Streptomyces misionensis TaxID=67331 RepID=UPI0033F4CCDF
MVPSGRASVGMARPPRLGSMVIVVRGRPGGVSLSGDPSTWRCPMDDHDRTGGWWARRSVWAKGGFVIAVLLVAFLALGAILSACEGPAGGERPDPAPSTATVTETVSETPVVPAPVPPSVETLEPDTSEPDIPETEAPDPVAPDLPEPATSAAAYYENCDAAREAGAAPLIRGEPGYRDELDREGDGVACEPYAGP